MPSYRYTTEEGVFYQTLFQSYMKQTANPKIILSSGRELHFIPLT